MICYSSPNKLSADFHKLHRIAFCAGLNGVQVDQVNRQNNSRSSRKTQFVASKLIAACSACTLNSKYMLSHSRHPQATHICNNIICWTKRSSSRPSE